MRIHIVRQNDTLYSISQKYNVPLDDLLRLNPGIVDPDRIEYVRKIKVPSREEKQAVSSSNEGSYVHQHVVQQGDSLWKISKAWGVSLEAIIQANPQLKNPHALLVGEIVNIPKAGAAPQPPANVQPPSGQGEKKSTGIIAKGINGVIGNWGTNKKKDNTAKVTKPSTEKVEPAKPVQPVQPVKEEKQEVKKTEEIKAKPHVVPVPVAPALPSPSPIAIQPAAEKKTPLVPGNKPPVDNKAPLMPSVELKPTKAVQPPPANSAYIQPLTATQPMLPNQMNASPMGKLNLQQASNQLFAKQPQMPKEPPLYDYPVLPPQVAGSDTANMQAVPYNMISPYYYAPYGMMQGQMPMGSPNVQPYANPNPQPQYNNYPYPPYQGQAYANVPAQPLQPIQPATPQGGPQALSAENPPPGLIEAENTSAGELLFTENEVPHPQPTGKALGGVLKQGGKRQRSRGSQKKKSVQRRVSRRPLSGFHTYSFDEEYTNHAKPWLNV